MLSELMDLGEYDPKTKGKKSTVIIVRLKNEDYD